MSWTSTPTKLTLCGGLPRIVLLSSWCCRFSSKGMTQKSQDMTVIYNGECPICSREIDAYQRYSTAHALPLKYTDLTQTDLTALGLTPDQAARKLHVLKDGDVLTGIDAFIALWLELPRMAWLGKAVRLPLVYPVAKAVYNWILAPVLFAMHKRRTRKTPKAARKVN